MTKIPSMEMPQPCPLPTVPESPEPEPMYPSKARPPRDWAVPRGGIATATGPQTSAPASKPQGKHH
ncbi:unnamed protein product [Chondrus crispus]|uniref:Uncharacterized protein n=1 Tax=Chondrus crispus TaxID=2769 RepID=R7QNU3_CHOCR|nr:unnamed protein product [Chondrus crispus]CDF39774.1 unnamed protein product [Chondrus crispus]|eukprot:XP_005710068.1 unnamed protein product [Chondrus crispus]